MTASTLADNGFEFIDALVDSASTTACAVQLAEPTKGAGQRHLIEQPAVVALLKNPWVVATIRNALGECAFAYKATLFDKHNERNWLVPWHQDVSIPVAARHDMEDWNGWSVKDGVNYVQPPTTMLSSLVALRVHLDDCNERNGPLRVLAGSHSSGRIQQNEIAALAASFEVRTIVGKAGSALLMRPLLIHASSKAISDERRRVLHLEFAACALPNPLAWHRRVML